MISITTVKQIRYVYKYRWTQSFQIRTCLLISGFSPWWHEKRDTILKSLCWSYYADPRPNTRHILWCLRSLSVEIQKTQLHLSTVKIQLVFLKSSNSQDHLFQAWHHPHSSLISCLVIVISFAQECKLHQLTMHLDWDSNGSNPYQTEWWYIINEEWLI